MRNINEDTITQAVIARHAQASPARLRELMTSLVQHLHAFAREVRLTEEERLEGIRFLTEVGKLSHQERQEFALLSDVLGLSMLVTAMQHRKPRGCTESTVFGPAPEASAAGEPCYVSGQVRSTDGTPLPGAELQVEPGEVQRTDAHGRFAFRGRVAQGYPVPHDGPVGRLLQSLGRHPHRPAHLQFSVSAPGHRPLLTHVFRRDDPYLDSDAVFGVRSSLIADWVRHERGATTPEGERSEQPFYTLDFDFVLATGDVLERHPA